MKRSLFYLNKNLNNSHNMSDNKESLMLKNLDKESLHTGSDASDSTCINSSSSQNDDSMSLKSDKKRPNPWQDDSVAKRFTSLEGDNIDMPFSSLVQRNLISQHATEAKVQYGKILPCQVILHKLDTSGHTDSKSKNVSKPNVAHVGQTSQASESMVAYANGQLSPKVRSRLEGAISHIFKPVKDQITVNFKEVPIEQAENMQRLVKQIIRDRIKRLMLGKHVGPHMEIVAVYRARFPAETDQDMLKAAYGTVKSSPKYIQADSSEEFFELNLEYILKKKLIEMFGKLEEVYSESRGPLHETDLRSTEALFEEKYTASNRDDSIEDNGISNNRKLPTLSLDEHDYVLQNLLRKMVPYLTQIMNLDYTHESKVADVILKTDNLRAPALGKEDSLREASNQDTVSGDNKENTEDKKSTRTATEKPLTASTLHYVKVIGRPTLPIKETMQTFLDQFNPKCVKKHKKQHNLLFVGFMEKVNFDAMITKNGITIGKCVIEIKASEATGGNKAAEKLSNNNVNKTDIS